MGRLRWGAEVIKVEGRGDPLQPALGGKTNRLLGPIQHWNPPGAPREIQVIDCYF